MRVPRRLAQLQSGQMVAGPTKSAAGLPEGFHFHDLRHTGNHLAASAGASTRELMHRMGHGSVRAALIYQHATADRDLEIARELSSRAKQARKRAKKAAEKKSGKPGPEAGPTEDP